MDDGMKKAVEEMAAGKEKGFNKVYSNTYNTVYWCAQDYVQNEEDIFELMHIVYIEAYKNISAGQKQDDITQWLLEITNRRGKELFKKQAVEVPEKEGAMKKEKTENTKETLDVKKAQRIYDACCVLLGLKSTTIEEDKKKVIISRKVKEKVKKTVADEVEGAVKDEIKKGLKALIASLSMKAKVALMAGAVTTTAVTAGVVGAVVTSDSEEDVPVDTVLEETEEQTDLSFCLALYVTTVDSYEGDPLVYPVKTAENEYTFMAEDIAKHFEDWEYAAVVVEDSMPEDMAVAYIEYGVNEEDTVKSFSDENFVYASCMENSNIVVIVVPKEEVEEVRRHMYD